MSSKRSAQSYVVAVGMMAMGLLLAAVCVAALLQGVEPRWSPALFGLLGLFMVYMGLDEGWLSELRVGPDAVRVRTYGRWEEHPLAGLEAVDGVRDFLGGGVQVILIARDREAVKVPMRRYANSGRLTQALLEAAWRHNRELIVLPRLERRLGRPPYGVFGPAEAPR